MGLLDFLKDTVGIDAGSHYLRIVKDGKLVFNERSQISIDKVNNIVSGIGDSVRTTANDSIIKPVNYVISDFHGFEMLLRGAMKKALNSKSLLPKSNIIFCSVPTCLTEIDKRAYRDSAEHSNAVEVHMVHQASCAAIGMNILFEKKHFILIDFSSSKIEMVVFANSLIISDSAIRFGTGKIFRVLKNHIRRKYKVELVDKEIEELLNSLNSNKDELKINYTTIKTVEIIDLLTNLFNLVNDELIETLERVSTHPDIQKVLMNGIYFTGGGSTFTYLREKIKLDDSIKTTLSLNPMLDNINGLKEVMANREKFKVYTMY